MAKSKSPGQMKRKDNDALPLSQSLSSYFNIIKSPSPVKPKQSKHYKSFAKRKDKEERCKPQNPSPTVLPFSLSDRTSFQCEIVMLSFAINLCNGDFDLLTQNTSILTWYEEWFLGERRIQG